MGSIKAIRRKWNRDIIGLIQDKLVKDVLNYCQNDTLDSIEE